MPEFSQIELHRRAAKYFRTIRGQGMPQSIMDLEPHIQEFEHLLLAEDFDDAAILLNDIGRNYLSLWGFLERVLEMRKQLLGKIKDSSLLVENYLQIADVYRMMGLPEQAILMGNHAADIATQIPDKELMSKSYCILGGIYRRLGQYESAIINLKKAIDFADNLKISDVQLQASLQLGQILYYINKIEEAKVILERALNLANSVKNRKMVGDLQGQLGYTEMWLGNVSDSIDYFSRALKIANEVGNKRGQGYWNLGLGEGYLTGGDYIKAKQFFISAKRIADEISDSHLYSYAGSFLAQCELQLGELHYALESIVNARERDNPQHNDYKAMLHGIILAKLDRIDDAELALESCLESGSDILQNNPNLLEAKWNRAISFMVLALNTKGMNTEKKIKEADNLVQSGLDTFADGVIRRYFDLLTTVKELDKKGVLTSIIEEVKSKIDIE